MKLQIPKKIRAEDFAEDQRETIQKLGFTFNSFADEVYQALNKRLDYDNLSRELVTVTIQIDTTGKLINPPQIKTSLLSKIRGIQTINAINLRNSTIYPTGYPFVSWTINGQIITVLNVTGLQNNSEYQLTLEVIS